jgi:hypothetical protein
MLGCGHVFDLFMRLNPFAAGHDALSAVPGPDQLHALKAPGRIWVFPDIGPAIGQFRVTQSPALAHLVQRVVRLPHAATGSR